MSGYRTAGAWALPHTIPPRRWEVVAMGPSRGSRRAAPPAYVIGEGPDDLAALEDLAERLAHA